MQNVIIVVGGAGFVGKTLVDRLIISRPSSCLVVADNLSNGNISHLQQYISGGLVHFLQLDCSDPCDCKKVFLYASKLGKINEVWHLAANSDIPSGVLNPNIDLKDTFQTTFEILNCIDSFAVKRLYFASSSAIYGDCGSVAITEDRGPLLPISNYGAMKLASEALISARSEQCGFSAFLFRFPNVVGAPATHGVILDFCKKLLSNPQRLDVLGDGTQKKAYLHVSDLVDAMLFLAENLSLDWVFPINIGPNDDGATVKFIAESVTSKISPDAEITYGLEPRGWVGDVPKFNYSIDKIKRLGWSPKLTSGQAISKAIDDILYQLDTNKS